MTLKRPKRLERARDGHTLVTIEYRVRNSVTGNYLKKLVGRDGIKPPTPGLSVLSFDVRKSAEILDLQSTLIRMSSSWSELE